MEHNKSYEENNSTILMEQNGISLISKRTKHINEIFLFVKYQLYQGGGGIWIPVLRKYLGGRAEQSKTMQDLGGVQRRDNELRDRLLRQVRKEQYKQQDCRSVIRRVKWIEHGTKYTIIQQGSTDRKWAEDFTLYPFTTWVCWRTTENNNKTYELGLTSSSCDNLYQQVMLQATM